MENPGKNNDKSKMEDDVARQIQRAHYQEGYRWAVARNWQYIYESDSDSEDDGLLNFSLFTITSPKPEPGPKPSDHPATATISIAQSHHPAFPQDQTLCLQSD